MVETFGRNVDVKAVKKHRNEISLSRRPDDILYIYTQMSTVDARDVCDNNLDGSKLKETLGDA